MSGFQVAALDGSIDRQSFDCGNEFLTRYFHQQATQDIRRRVAFCFVATDAEGIIGYYTLASATVSLRDLADEHKKKLPRYGEVPCVLMGRLAVALDRKRLGFGAALLADALQRSLRADIAAHAMIVDPIDREAGAFYAKHGFIHALPHRPARMFLSLVTAAAASQQA